MLDHIEIQIEESAIAHIRKIEIPACGCLETKGLSHGHGACFHRLAISNVSHPVGQLQIRGRPKRRRTHRHIEHNSHDDISWRAERTIAFVHHNSSVVWHIVIGPRVVNDYETINRFLVARSDDDCAHSKKEAVHHGNMRWINQSKRCIIQVHTNNSNRLSLVNNYSVAWGCCMRSVVPCVNACSTIARIITITVSLELAPPVFGIRFRHEIHLVEGVGRLHTSRRVEHTLD